MTTRQAVVTGGLHDAGMIRIAALTVALLVTVVLGMELLSIAAQLLPGPFYDPLCGRDCYPLIR